MSQKIVNLEEIKTNSKVMGYLNAANQHMKASGYTEHGERHAGIVSTIARKILSRLQYPERLAELAAIAGYLHDIGNMISRMDHGQIAARLALNILEEIQMSPEEVTLIVGAIGNHEEEVGDPVNEVSAALILADKADVHRSRVHNPNLISFDIHDRVNYAAEKSYLNVEKESRRIALELTIDTRISQVMEYFEIFISRMVICRRAAKFLDCRFELLINEVKLL